MPSVDAVRQYWEDRGWNGRDKTLPKPIYAGLELRLDAAAQATYQGKLYNPAPSPAFPKPSGDFKRRPTEADGFANSGIQKHLNNDFTGALEDFKKAKRLGGSRFSDEQMDAMIEKTTQYKVAAKSKGINL